MSGDGPRLLRIGVIAFVAAVAVFFLLGLWLGPPRDDTPRFVLNEVPRALDNGVVRVTLDVQDPDTHVDYNLGLGRRVEDASDVRVRRYVLQAPHGALDLGPVPWGEARVAAGAAWQSDAVLKGELQNPALAGWYDYSYWTHRLSSKDHTYAVRTTAGGIAYVKVVGYYCAPAGAGCLTLDYRLESPQARSE